MKKLLIALMAITMGTVFVLTDAVPRNKRDVKKSPVYRDKSDVKKLPYKKRFKKEYYVAWKMHLPIKKRSYMRCRQHELVERMCCGKRFVSTYAFEQHIKNCQQ